MPLILRIHNNFRAFLNSLFDHLIDFNENISCKHVKIEFLQKNYNNTGKNGTVLLWCMSKKYWNNAICSFWRLIMVHLLIYVLLNNAHTFYLCIDNNDAKKVTTLRILEWKVGNKSSDTLAEQSRVSSC